MRGKTAKMLRAMKSDKKSDKRLWNSLQSTKKAKVRAEFLFFKERGFTDPLTFFV